MVILLITNILGILIFLFIFWRKLKEDYASEIIFKSAFYTLIGIAVGIFVSWKIYSQAFLWMAFVGSLIGVGVSSYMFKERFYECLEALVIAALPWLSFVFLSDSVINSSPVSFFAFLVTLVMMFVYYFFEQRYKGFAWYKSGKVGFAGLATLGIIFIIRSAIAVGRFDVISFLAGYEGIISGAAAFISFLLIFNLGRQKE